MLPITPLNNIRFGSTYRQYYPVASLPEEIGYFQKWMNSLKQLLASNSTGTNTPKQLCRYEVLPESGDIVIYSSGVPGSRKSWLA